MTLMTMMNSGDEAAIAEAKKENTDIFNVKKSEWERRRREPRQKGKEGGSVSGEERLMQEKR